MFQASLIEKLKRIFDLDKVTFDAPGETVEQECVFVGVEKSTNFIKENLEVARVTGRIRVFAQNSKLPFGYFSKRISLSDLEDTQDIFFYDFEENSSTFRNICERSVGFVFFYRNQYNPETGIINEINFIEQVSE